MTLADKKCIPCHGGIPPLDETRSRALLLELGSPWELNVNGHLERLVAFGDFMEALAFANRVGELAELEGHHPDLHISWAKCRVEIWTHAIDGLAESDFFLAAKIERLISG
ncbi:MAG: 4a-hydroxytetrahydrobiopterin dehydratase [Myxococcales bacterium]|nr:4a-hydroxytetrahydrobiopterin dehydratase [Myxococcales bacterium]